jgi:hypothetical protein
LAHSDNDNDYNNYNDSDDSFYVPNSTPNKTYNEISDDDNDNNSGILGSSSSSMDIARESEYDSDYDSNDSSYDGADLTDLGVGSGLILEYIETKLSSEPDYEWFANNGASIGFAEAFGKFMDQYETKLDNDGKLIEGFNLFDQDSIPYDDLLQALRSSQCQDRDEVIHVPNSLPKEAPCKKSDKAKPATTATMKVSQPKAPRWTRPRKTPHKIGAKALATVPKTARKKKQVFSKARMKRLILARSKVVIARIRRGRAPKFKILPVDSTGIMMTSEPKQVSEPKPSSNGSKWMEAILHYIMFLSSTSETTHHCVA